MRIWEREPVALLALVQAVVVLAVAFGADVSVKQAAAISLVTAAALTLTARQLVTPVAYPDPAVFASGEEG